MPPWISQISSYQKKESKFNSNRWIHIATIGTDNCPRVRTVVFRGWSQSYEMKLFTDKRSQKFTELELNNNVEICWLFSKSKCQFRLRGKVELDKSDETILHWNKLNDKEKLMWVWPTPGETYIFEKNKNQEKDISNINRKNFALLKVDIFHVDQLILQKGSHFRRRWIRQEDWIEQRINP